MMQADMGEATSNKRSFRSSLETWSRTNSSKRARTERPVARVPAGQVLAAFALLEVAEDCPRIDAEIARRLRPVAAVQRQDLVDVVPLKFLLRLGERQDRRQIVG